MLKVGTTNLKLILTRDKKNFSTTKFLYNYGKNMKKVKFIDAQKMAKKHPKTFFAPTKQELAALKKGDIVKVCPGMERFWVEIIEIDKQKVKGIVDNNLIFSNVHGLKLNSIVHFEKKHIYDIYEEDKAPTQTRCRHCGKLILIGIQHKNPLTGKCDS